MTRRVNRRGFLRTSAGMAAVGLAAGGPGMTQQAGSEPADIRRLRQEGRRKTRRIIYNDDGDELIYSDANTPEGFLSKRLRNIAGTQVDSVFYCTGVTTAYAHLAEVGEVLGEYVEDGSGAYAVNTRDNIRALQRAGHDVLELAVDFCHTEGLEVFFSHRINDIHDTFTPWLVSRWKREHPECLMGTREEGAKAGGGNSPRHWWSALDFEKPEVLDYLVAITQDVCERYDIDGVEIDYFRSPMFFKPNLDFEPATDEQVDVLTGFQRRLRQMTHGTGAKRGRPILMATRVPATPGACRHVGIDMARWLAEDLLDLLPVGGGYVPFTEPVDEITALAHSHGIQVYPTISASGMRGREGGYGTQEAWRGAAANMWRRGADGIYTFNIFPPAPDARFSQMGSPETLQGLSKLFVIDNVACLEGDLVQGIEQSQILPASVPDDGRAAALVLPIGDDIPAAAARGAVESLSLRVQISDASYLDAVELRFNGKTPSAPKLESEGAWLNFEPAAEDFRPGDNHIELRVLRPRAEDDAHLQVLSVEAEVVYG